MAGTAIFPSIGRCVPRCRSCTRIIRFDDHAGGFSLLELLVVIGISAVLIGMLMPALRAANEAARATRCSSQLRQMGVAIFAYASANRGMTPPWGGAFRIDNSSDPAIVPLSHGWIAMLSRYTGAKANSPLFHCPSFPVEDDTVNYFMEAHWENLQFPVVHSIALSHVRLSSQFVLAAEATAQCAYIPPFGTYNATSDNTDKDDSGHQDLLFFGEAGGYNMHRAGNNILFADGHVQIFARRRSRGRSRTARIGWRIGRT